MNKKRVTYMALGAFVFAASCSKEAAEPDFYDWDDGKIYFRPSVSGLVGSRAQDMTLERLESFQVTCFNSADTVDPEGHLSPYFENATFVRKVSSPSAITYVSSPGEEPHDWPVNDGFMSFFAFSPSLKVMAEENTALEDKDMNTCFNLINESTGSGSSVSLGYRLGNVRINPDISRQFDFVTAHAAGERWKDFTKGIELSFSHQLCQVELKAWGANPDYDFEIAGVRIGNPVVEGTYVFADDASAEAAQGWELEGDGIKDKVEYLYRSGEDSGAGDQPTKGDRIFRINNTEHNTAISAGTIMGQAGCAMVIPTVNTRWEGASGGNADGSSYSTDRMYFSVLIRITDRRSGDAIYPYPGNPDDMKVESYATDISGNILTHLYSGETAGEYFTDPELQHPYEIKEGIEIKDFGWAAVPVDADWSAGKRYVYTLNYSDGVGLHDPEDPDPGKPIAGKSSSIVWGVGVEIWDYAEKDDNFDPELNVP